MIDSLIRWSLHNRAIVLGFAAVFLIWGGYSISQMPVDVLPDLSAPTVTILVEGPGMVPTEMEPLVTLPIESALNGAAGVRRVRSATAVGVAVIWVEFNWGQDIQRARQVVTEKLGTVTGALPPGVETPFLAPVSSIMGEILFISWNPTSTLLWNSGPLPKPWCAGACWRYRACRRSLPPAAARSSIRSLSIRAACEATTYP